MNAAQERSGATDQAIVSPTQSASAPRSARQASPNPRGTGTDHPSSTIAPSAANAPIQNSRPSEVPSPKKKATKSSAPETARVAGPASLAACIAGRR